MDEPVYTFIREIANWIHTAILQRNNKIKKKNLTQILIHLIHQIISFLLHISIMIQKEVIREMNP